MFCKWCGKRITDNGTLCPHCGQKQSPLENGNGFWDLCKNTESGKPNNDRKERKTKKLRNPFLIPAVIVSFFLSCITMIAVIVCLVMVSGVRKELHSLQTEMSHLQYTLQACLDEPTSDEVPADEPWWTAAVFESTDKIRIQKYQLNREDHLYLYLASGIEHFTEISICWQKSTNEGQTWTVTSQNTNCMIAYDTDARYRMMIRAKDEIQEESDSDMVHYYCIESDN